MKSARRPVRSPSAEGQACPGHTSGLPAGAPSTRRRALMLSARQEPCRPAIGAGHIRLDHAPSGLRPSPTANALNSLTAQTDRAARGRLTLSGPPAFDRERAKW
jgi:hypothetical protein